MADEPPMVPLNARTLAETKAAAIALAAKRGVKLSGLVNLLLVREIAADRAQTLVASPRSERVLGAARNVTRTVLAADCLHPIHLREQLPLHDVCRAPGCGHTFPRRT